MLINIVIIIADKIYNIIIFQEAKDDSEQEPVAITKSLYMKVEDWVRILLISRSDYTHHLKIRFTRFLTTNRIWWWHFPALLLPRSFFW